MSIFIFEAVKCPIFFVKLQNTKRSKKNAILNIYDKQTTKIIDNALKMEAIKDVKKTNQKDSCHILRESMIFWQSRVWKFRMRIIM